MYINIHTHKPQKDRDIFNLQNIRFAFEAFPKSNGNYSIGLHPWDINAYTGNDLTIDLTQAAKTCKAIAIGEIGLDRNCDTPFDLQQQSLEIQLKIAKSLQLPIILHCVKAYSETITLLQKNSIKSACIVHGFNKNLQIAALLLQAGCFLSFGKAILTNKKLQEVFKTVPLTQIFLETDDADIDIQAIYQQAATLKNITIKQLQNQLSDNFNRCFKWTKIG